MAFDYGSIDLGIKNPFKTEGLINTIGGAVGACVGIYMLIDAASSVKTEVFAGWILALFGLGVLTSGIITLAKGIIAMLRYFVGRNHPTSLARNLSDSQSQTAQQESAYVAYSNAELPEMLMGRKNITFTEPQGIVARLLHSFFPRLTYMPYMVRNLAQYLFAAWVKTALIFIVYALVAFVTLAGFAGEVGAYIFPVYSIVVVVHLLVTWYQASRYIGVQRNVEKTAETLAVKDIAKTIAGAILIPTVIGFGLQMTFDMLDISLHQVQQFISEWPSIHPYWFMISIVIAGAIVSGVGAVLLKARLSYGEPVVEVSELRENWQESVHPNEVFINLDNLVMANRRYKEVPNRVYQMLEPNLNEQVDGKGSFRGEMTQEVQPQIKEMDLGHGFNLMRLNAVIVGRVLFVIGALLSLWLANSVVNAYLDAKSLGSGHSLMQTFTLLGQHHAAIIIDVLLAALLVRTFGLILSKTGHLFYAEMLFESNLIYIKVEGTFTESKISTGAGINDSTRSENVLVRSSITPWVIVSKVISSTFASTGMKNLEYPRYILEMHKNEPELNGIKQDMVSFLKDRESIASITSERDLRNASQIHDINQQSRSTHDGAQQSLDNAAGYIRQQDNPDQENL
ncbi:hypothetical protein [Vibrio nitrifigilis]|uniref:Uncharacterized protein n=1 Tax=Vibrio nitrifigilis TaxID=2789781 RepID=A0ABS0GKN3_9VIBR|nr:hypothetical protein [Vibrio nitrifigilis]MBF9002892.1 hypothetical protein [Vibrio nitrifigilis]